MLLVFIFASDFFEIRVPLFDLMPLSTFRKSRNRFFQPEMRENKSESVAAVP